ncbi:S-adenosyl-L-methionine-dependent methyltransferase [Boletus edulis]|nr:S-adenosyl-L-methionine-dependent methyltransferase [Boletus edulis]KAF8120893.1 S-adenosyl-L-methionine-dependent methyltransferase [Boletus edulis]
MATFGKATFNAVSYAASRPTYPRALFDYVFRFHGAGAGGGRWDTAVDLGCGTGQATVELTPFKQIVGVDPSAGMVDAARRALVASGSQDSASESGTHNEQTTFVQSPAEKLTFLADGSVDVIIAAQAGHWFDWSRMWPEAARVLRKDGTFAIWNYSELRLPKYPTLTLPLTHFFQGTDPETSIGPYWQQPGRSILEEHLVGIPDARDVVPGAFKALERLYFTGAYHPHLPSPQPILMRKRMTWNDLHAYLRTASALHTFLEQHPEDTGNPEGDLATRFWRSLMRGAGVQNGEGVAVSPEEMVEVEWPLAMILARRA